MGWSLAARVAAAFLVCMASIMAACGGPQARPQVGIERGDSHYPPLGSDAPVKLYPRGEPQVSYREIGKVTSTCPESHWVGGREEKGRPICRDGLRQGARKLGGQAVIEVKTNQFRPSWAPSSPWLIMKGVVVRLRP